MSGYSSEQIDFIEAKPTADGGIEVQVKPMLETAFYLAGATMTEVDGRRKMTLVRCGLRKTCAVDIKAEANPGTPDPMRMRLEGTGLPLDVVYTDRQVEIFAP